MVENLPITSDNFSIANDLLNSEFLDENLLVDSIWQSLVYHKKCVNLAENSEFITLIKCKIQELEKFKLSFKSENNPQIVAHSMFSYIIRSKLYAPFLEENIRKLHNNYPSFDIVLANANEITKLLSHRERYIGNKLKTVDSVKYQPKDKIKN